MPRFAANLSTMFTEHPFLDRFEAAAQAGFTGVEYLFPYDFSAEEIRTRLNAYGLQQALFNTFPGDWKGGERGVAALPNHEARFQEYLNKALNFAKIISPQNIHIMAGCATGPSARAIYIANLKSACARAPHQNFVIEPINSRDMPGYHLTTSSDAREVIEKVGASNLKLQLDLYHCQIMEGDLTRRIEALAPIIAHVQIASVPGRNEPDRGETSLLHLIETLDRVGYQGWIGCEYHPIRQTEDGLGWLDPYRKVLS